MNHYEEKLEARRERLLARAEKLESEAAGRHKQADAMFGAMNGTPILVGHHSEKRHRRDLDRAWNNIGKSVQLEREAEELRRRAESVGSGGIATEDPEALVKLRTKLENLRRNQEQMKAINAAWRKAKKPAPDNQDAWQTIADLVGMSDNDLRQLRLSMARDPLDRAPFTYHLTNNNANMKRVEGRIKELEAREGLETKSHHLGEVEIVENVEENRVQILFPGKPSAEVRRQLKANGFRWAPSQGAWQRHLNRNAVHLAITLVTATEGM